MAKCIVPYCKRKPTKHHFPLKKCNGGKSTVDICRYHHNLAEEEDVDVVEIIIKRAPLFWVKNHQWNSVTEHNYWNFVRKWRAKHPLDKKESNILYDQMGS